MCVVCVVMCGLFVLLDYCFFMMEVLLVEFVVDCMV